MPSKRLLAFGAALATMATVALASAHPLRGARDCPVFPKDNPWNQRVDRMPVDANSAQLVESIGLGAGVHPDFGSGIWDGAPIGIPYVTVSRRQRKVPVTFGYASESNKGPYPIPANVPIEGGRSSSGDRHVIVVDRDRCRAYELYAAYPVAGGSHWRARSGAIWNLRSNRLRPKNWTSADAAGLPILPGLARYEEVKRGAIDHALRFTAPRTRRAYVYPATHYASSSNDPALPPMGLRVRLKASYDISRFPRQSRVVLQALKRYGMILADNGSPWYVSGSPSSGWNDDDLHQLGKVHGDAFEVVAMPVPAR
jgi:hypothetical protein